MIKQSELEQIKNVIKCGYDLKSISVEFNIPMEVVEMCKIQLENEQVKGTNVAENKSVYSKMEQMRERYKTLYSRTDKKKDTKMPQGLIQHDIDLINSVIATIEKIIGEMKETSTPNKSASAVLDELEKITDYQLTIEQLERLNSLMAEKEFARLDKRRNRSSF